MKRNWIASLILVFASLSTAHSQLQVDVSQRIEALVQNVLLGGGGDLVVGNIRYQGHSRAIGKFDNRDVNTFPMPAGIVLSTGEVSHIIGPNQSPKRSDRLDTDGDRMLDRLSTRPTKDAAIIEFDFVPLSNRVTFTYIFASEEYVEFTGSRYNDIFAFFISGPGIDSTLNMAVIPGTKETVTINTVNQYINSEYFVDNNPWTLAGARIELQNKSSLSPDLVRLLEFDGLTRPLTASTLVIPGQKYHFKIAIADVSDGKYNSAVFLKGGSFQVETDTTAQGNFSMQNAPTKADALAVLQGKTTAPPPPPAPVREPDTPRSPKGQVADVVMAPVMEEMPISRSPHAPPKRTADAPLPDGVAPLMLPAYFEPVQFDTGEDTLDTRDQAALGVLADMLRVHTYAQLRITGHTDGMGETTDNEVLSKRRAEAVAEYLVLRGISRDRLHIEFKGENAPVAPNTSLEGMRQNRRVELYIFR